MNTCMSTCIVFLTRSHEDMLFHEGGVCDTLGIQVFLRFSGELVSFEELGQLDLIKVLQVS